MQLLKILFILLPITLLQKQNKIFMKFWMNLWNAKKWSLNRDLFILHHKFHNAHYTLNILCLSAYIHSVDFCAFKFPINIYKQYI